MREGYGGQGGLSTAWEAGHGIIHHQERKHPNLHHVKRHYLIAKPERDQRRMTFGVNVL